MQIALQNRKKASSDSPRRAFKKKNKVEEGGASTSRMKKEQENIDLKTQKMMRVRVELFIVPTMVQAIKQTVAIPQMTFPQER